MFDDDHGVALIPQVLQGVEQPLVVALVQSDRRFVQHVEHPGQPRPDLARQTNPLALTARQRVGLPRQGQVLQPHIDQESEPVPQLLQDRCRNLRMLFPQLPVEADDPRPGLGYRKIGEFPDVQPVQLDRKGLLPQPVSGAILAFAGIAVFLEILPHMAGGGFQVAALKVRDDPLEPPPDRVGPIRVGVDEIDLGLARPVKQHLTELLRQVAPAPPGIHAIVPGQAFDRLFMVDGAGIAPVGDRPLHQHLCRVRNDESFVEEGLRSQPVAARAGTGRNIEGKEARLDLGNREAGHRTGELLREGDASLRAVGVNMLGHGKAVGAVECRPQRIGQTPADALLHDDPVNHEFNVVPEVLLQFRRLVEFMVLTVDPDANEAHLAVFQELLAVFALTVPDHGRKQG